MEEGKEKGAKQTGTKTSNLHQFLEHRHYKLLLRNIRQFSEFSTMQGLDLNRHRFTFPLSDFSTVTPNQLFKLSGILIYKMGTTSISFGHSDD